MANGIAAGEFTAEAIMRDCLGRIEEREAAISAWASFDPEIAMTQAREADRTTAKGVLHGVPIGVKDVIDTFDYPTQMGSEIYRGHRSKNDAACVALLRAAGAIVLGKTITCEFAGMTPGATRNPLDLTATPGGSSSGSAAAVADHMVPLALGTQTRGSVLRPASYCGIVGFKPSYGLVARSGLKFAAESLDTIGVLAGTIDDAALCASVLSGQPTTKRQSLSAPPSIGVCRDGLGHAEAESVKALEDAEKQLSAAGAKLQSISFPHDVEAFTAATKIINDVERARSMAWEWQTNRDLISERLREAVEQGLAVPAQDYFAALRLMADCQSRLQEDLEGFEAILAPCANGEAPSGIGYTGDPFFQGLWTALHVPTISLPTSRGPNGLPVGIQLVGHQYKDEALLSVARWAFGCF